MADHIIDIGPEGGKHGGKDCCRRNSEQIIKNKNNSN